MSGWATKSLLKQEGPPLPGAAAVEGDLRRGGGKGKRQLEKPESVGRGTPCERQFERSRLPLRLTKFPHFDGFFGDICNLKAFELAMLSVPARIAIGSTISISRAETRPVAKPSRRNPILEAFS
ncbi:MAG: hypothetical protein ABI617_03150 [Sphingomicrobium sp.]